MIPYHQTVASTVASNAGFGLCVLGNMHTQSSGSWRWLLILNPYYNAGFDHPQYQYMMCYQDYVNGAWDLYIQATPNSAWSWYDGQPNTGWTQPWYLTAADYGL